MAKASPRPLTELDLASRQNIERIVALEPHELNNGDRAFMRARMDYLTADQIKDYATDDIVGEDPETEDEETYADWGMDELKTEVEARGLEINGNKNAKAPYVEALEADDAANGE